ncbi:unnamed protein product [Orchesella dallaii]|uniref:NCK-interacting protein with SH3 domain n=1 Tax=Orchesella dallaii TaxID=48710 RepID=A0ABP1QEJ6_9HEXA
MHVKIVTNSVISQIGEPKIPPKDVPQGRIVRRKTALHYHLQQVHKGHGLTNPHFHEHRFYRHGNKPKGFHDYQNLQWDPSIYRGRTFRDFREKNLPPFTTTINFNKYCSTDWKKHYQPKDVGIAPNKPKKVGLPRLKIGGIIRPTTDDIIDEEISGHNRHKQDESMKEMEPFIVEQIVIPKYKETGTNPDLTKATPMKYCLPINVGPSKASTADICVIGLEDDPLQPIVSNLGTKVVEQSLLESFEEYELRQIRKDINKYIEKRRNRQIRETKVIHNELLRTLNLEKEKIRREKEFDDESEAEGIIGARIFSTLVCHRLTCDVFDSLRDQHFMQSGNADIIQTVELTRGTIWAPLTTIYNGGLYKEDEELGEEPYPENGEQDESGVGPPPNSASTVLFTSEGEDESGMEDEETSVVSDMDIDIAEANTEHIPDKMSEEDEGVCETETGPCTQFHEKIVEVVRGRMEDNGSVRGSTSSYPFSPRYRSISAGSSSNRKNKYRLCVEMNIRPRALSESSGVESEECCKDDPISVVVDYPEDLVVCVNARIRKNEVDTNKDPSDVPLVGRDSKVTGAEMRNPDIILSESENQDKVMNSTFVKVPYTSTLIYPIMEEQENDEVESERVLESDKEKELTPSRFLQTSFRKSADSSLYKTGLDGNDAMFGDLSAIFKIDVAGDGVVKPEDAVDSDDALHNSNADFKGHPSLSLNSRARMCSEKLTPAEKLVKALHVIARYRGAWGVFEDDQRIVSHLINLNGLLTMTDASIIEAICTDEDHCELNGLISYFLLEKRFIIRSELIQTFKLMCNKSNAIASVILSSDIPVIVAIQVVENEYTSREIYDYSLFFLQMISAVQLSDEQCGDIGHGFYSKVIELTLDAEKNHFESIAEILFRVYLKYHQQLIDEKDLKWDCLSLLATANPQALKKLKDKLISPIVKNGTTISMTYRSYDRVSIEKIREMLKVLTDLMICTCTREIFSDAELDILLVTLIHFMEKSSLMIDFQTDTFKAIYQILKTIQTEPSGLDRLRRVVKKVVKEADSAGDSYNRPLLKKICKILNRA